MTKPTRKTGIDFLRMLSMYMVVVLHVLGHGGVLEHTQWMSNQYVTAWALEIAVFCGVNCFGLISGYVGYTARFRWSKLASLWMQVVFYSFGICALFAVSVPESVGKADLLKSLLPVTDGTYWYITAYVGMFLFVPLLNLVIEKLPKRQVKLFLLALTVVYVVLPTVTMRDPYTLEGGYCVLWLCILYLLGGWIKKYGVDKKIRRRHALLLFGVSSCLTLLSKLALEFITFHLWGTAKYGGMFVKYTSPLIILNAVALLCLFSQTEFHTRIWRKLVCFLSPAALGVYLIHDNPLIRQYGMNQAAALFSDDMPVYLVLRVLGVALGIYLLCSVVELGRLKLFSLLRVQQRLKWVDERLGRMSHE